MPQCLNPTPCVWGEFGIPPKHRNKRRPGGLLEGKIFLGKGTGRFLLPVVNREGGVRDSGNYRKNGFTGKFFV